MTDDIDLIMLYGLCDICGAAMNVADVDGVMSLICTRADSHEAEVCTTCGGEGWVPNSDPDGVPNPRFCRDCESYQDYLTMPEG